MAKAFSLRNDRKQQQTMKPEPPETEKDLGKDLKTFGQLPAKSKELLILQDQTEKSTGQEKVELHKMTRDKSKESDPRPAGSL